MLVLPRRLFCNAGSAAAIAAVCVMAAAAVDAANVAAAQGAVQMSRLGRKDTVVTNPSVPRLKLDGDVATTTGCRISRRKQ